MDEPPSAKRRRITVEVVRQSPAPSLAGTPRIKREKHVPDEQSTAASPAVRSSPTPSTGQDVIGPADVITGGDSQEGPSLPDAPSAEIPASTKSDHSSSNATPVPQALFSTGMAPTPPAASSLEPDGVQTPSDPGQHIAPGAEGPTGVNQTEVQWVACFCKKCDTKLGRFTNNWVQVGASFHHPIESDPENRSLIICDPKKQTSKSGGPLEGWTLQSFRCAKCRESCGMKCVDSPPGMDRYKDWDFYTLGRLRLVSDATGTPVEPVIRESIIVSGRVNTLPATVVQRQSTPGSSVMRLTRSSTAEAHANGERAKAPKPVGPKHPLSNVPPGAQIESSRYAPPEKTMAMLKEHSMKIGHHSTELDRLRQFSVFTLNAVDNQKMQQDCLAAILDGQKKGIDYVSDKVERLQRDMTDMRQMIQEMRREIREVRAQPVAPAKIMPPPRRDEGSVTFAMEEMELLTSSITTIGNKANEVDSLKMQLAMLKRRIQMLEEGGTNEKSSRAPPSVQPESFERPHSKQSAEQRVRKHHRVSELRGENDFDRGKRPSMNGRGTPVHDSPKTRPNGGLSTPSPTRISSKNKPPKHVMSTGNSKRPSPHDDSAAGNYASDIVESAMDEGSNGSSDEDEEDSEEDILAFDPDDPDDADYVPGGRIRDSGSRRSENGCQRRQETWKAINPNSLWHPDPHESDYGTPRKTEAKAIAPRTSMQNPTMKDEPVENREINADRFAKNVSRKWKMYSPSNTAAPRSQVGRSTPPVTNANGMVAPRAHAYSSTSFHPAASSYPAAGGYPVGLGYPPGGPYPGQAGYEAARAYSPANAFPHAAPQFHVPQAQSNGNGTRTPVPQTQPAAQPLPNAAGRFGPPPGGNPGAFPGVEADEIRRRDQMARETLEREMAATSWMEHMRGMR